jgi:7-keto-8-aminopelargonate synthetase-like enzyme
MAARRRRTAVTRASAQGERLANCEKQIFRHNDMAHLQELLAVAAPTRPKLIVFESLYSMDGDVAHVPSAISPTSTAA